MEPGFCLIKSNMNWEYKQKIEKTQLVHYTMSGSFLLSIEKPLVEKIQTPNATKTTTTTPTALYGIRLNVLDIAAGFIIPPRTIPKIMIPIDKTNAVSYTHLRAHETDSYL